MNNKENNNDSLLEKEYLKFWEEGYYKQLSGSTLLDVYFAMSELYILAEEYGETVEKIKRCVEVTKESHAETEHGQIIIEQLTKKFFPLLRKQQEPVKDEDITEIANLLGSIVQNSDENSEMAVQCKKAFVETILLNEGFVEYND